MKFKFLIITVFVAFSSFLYSCSKVDDFGDINKDPSKSTEPVTSALLTNVLSQLPNSTWGNGLSINSGLYAQLFSETQYTETSRYATPTLNFDAIYTGVLADLQNIIQLNTNPNTAGRAAANGSNANQIAIARILKAYYFRYLTDLYGDIPYFGALKGLENPTAVAYDPVENIYPDLLKELKEAVAQFDNGAAVKGDILFGGNVSKWQKLGNSIRFLIALNMAKRNAATAQQEMNAVLTHPAGVISSKEDNAVITPPGGVFNHPLYQYYNITQRFDYAVSSTVTDYLKSNSDPRVSAYGSSDIGVPYGLTRDNATAFTNANPKWAMILDSARRLQKSPVVIIGAAHMNLARAEAAVRGLTTENAASLYAEGIRQSFEQWGVYTATDFTNYMAQPAIALTAGTALQKVATQEWLAWFPNGFEAWNVWRRTGFPTLTPAPGASAIPRRFPYGPNAFTFNLEGANAAAAKYTVSGVPNSMFGRLWWDF